MHEKAVSDIAFTPSVQAVQQRLGSREVYEGVAQRGGWKDEITADLGEPPRTRS